MASQAQINANKRNSQRSTGPKTEAGKAFDGSAPIGLIRPVDRSGHPTGRISLAVNGAVRQRARTSDFIFDMATQVAWISQIMPLEPGDLVLTGTPRGPGRLAPGDSVTVEISGVGALTNTVVQGP